MEERREFLMNVAIFMGVQFIILLIITGAYIYRSYQLTTYKAKYQSAINWIREEMPLEQESELMSAITAVIEQNARLVK